MKVGFTGTREGMTGSQGEGFTRQLVSLSPTEFHHGACIGADSEAVHCAFSAVAVLFVAHPSDVPRLTCQAALGWSGVKRDPKPPLKRNRDIVDACEVLIACPKGPEELRSGTWATVRYARRRGKRIVIIWPDGTVTEEAPTAPAAGGADPSG